MPLTYLDEPGPSQGMIRDEPSWLIPPGAVYDSLNLVYDKPGMARQRMGTTALVSGSQTAFSTSIGFAYSQDSTLIEELYGLDGKTGNLNLINKTTGATTALGTPAPTGLVGRPARHFGFLVFPVAANAQVTHGAVSVAGQTTNTSFTSTAVAGLNANDPQIVLSAPDTTTNIKVGAIVTATFLDVNLTQWVYSGRVVSVDTSIRFTVWPIPSVTGTAQVGGIVIKPFLNSTAGGTCATSFQNRLLIGNSMNLGAATPLRNDRRVIYSILPTETSGGNIGATFVSSGSWPRLNYFDVPGSDPIVAMEPISEGELVILTSKDLIILNGNLTTQTTTSSPTITYDIYPLGTTYGCLSDLSVHRTPIGIMWAGNEGVFAYWPPLRRNPAKTGIRNQMDNKILTYWQTLVNGANFAIHGAAYVRNHYIVSGSSGGVTFSLACNLQNDAWTRLSGVGTDTFTSVARPSIPQQSFAARWWDQTGAAPSMTNGQTLRLESMLNPYVTGATTTDADGGVIGMSLTTRTLTGDPELQKLFQRGTVRYQLSKPGGANVTVTAQSRIDAADTDASSTRTLGTLSSTATATITNATNANPIVYTTSANHGLQTQDFVDIDAVLGNLNANGRYRISVLSNTSFSVPGLAGSGAYTSGGKVKKLTETDYQLSDLNAGQGASFTIAGSPDNYEHHGIRIAVLQKEPVASS